MLLGYTTSKPSENIPVGYGFIGLLVTVIGFGINFLPIKKVNAGDGMFFQWIVCNAIFIGSFPVAGYYNFPKFEPLVILGGFIWSTGNICVVPIVNLIGLGKGILLWSSSSIIISWLSTRFGWFGIDPELPNNLPMNYIGFVFTAICPMIYGLIKPNVNMIHSGHETEAIPILTHDSTDNIQTHDNSNSHNRIIHFVKKRKSKFLAIGLSLFSGILYGLMFIPLLYVKNRYPNSSKKDITYILPQCTGIYLGSSMYFIIYCIIKRNKPHINPKCILPALASGFIWFIAYIGYFIANEALSAAICQPIVSALPGLLSIIITTLFFKEIRGLKNYMIILVGIIITFTGVILIALSKIY